MPGKVTSADIAAALLLRARRALVYGLERATVEAQRRAVEIADLIGGVIDPASSASHGASVLAFQRIGHVTATLGALRERADLIVYWGGDPDVRYPGFRARYVERARAPTRVTVAVDIGDTRGPADVDERFVIDPAWELEALWILRARLRGRRIELSGPSALSQRREAGSQVERHASRPLPLPPLDRLAKRLRHCRYGVILHDADPPPGRRDAMLPLALGAATIEANRTARVRLIGVRRPGNAVGAETVLTWQTGFPFAVDFSRGYPRYAPGEFTADRLLTRGEVDAALLVGVDAPIDLTGAALAHLERIPTVVVGGPNAWSARGTQAWFMTPPFEALAGSIYRMDGVALRRRRADDVRNATGAEDAAILARLSNVIRERLSVRDPHVRGPDVRQ